MGTFVVIDGDIWETNDKRQVVDAQDAAAECGTDVLAQFDDTDSEVDDDFNPVSARLVGPLVARVYVVVPFTRTRADDWSDQCSVIVRARDTKHAHELVADKNSGAEDDDFWSKEANESGDTPEFCDDDAFYKCWPCDCGDDGCHDDDSDHETQTEMVAFHFSDAKEFATVTEARESPDWRAKVVEFLNG